MGCQTVLLKGCERRSEGDDELMHGLRKRECGRITLHGRPGGGWRAFRTTVQKGLEISGAAGWTSGLAVPQFVIDSPVAGGKVPLLPEYVERSTR